MSAFVSIVGWTLIHFVWQGLLIGAATAAALAALRHARPQQRYLVACAGLLLCLGWPALELTARLSAAHTAGGAPMHAAALAAAGIADGGVMLVLQRHIAWLVSFWAMCAALLMLRMGLGLLWIGRIGRREDDSDPLWQARLQQLALQFGVQRVVRLRVVRDLASPLTAGWWRPVVLVPAALLTGMAPELLDALLAHEMAHIRRYDYLVNLLQNLVETLLFYHPAVWWISHRIRVEREQIADDIAAGHLGAPRRLALALSELERIQFSGHHIAIAANGGDLMTRIQRLLRPASPTPNWKAALPVLGAALICVAVTGCAAMQAATEAKRPVEHKNAVFDFHACDKPRWPQASLLAGETGTVTMAFQVNADGKVGDTVIKKTSGHPALDEAAREGIALCTFKPATDDGVAVQSWIGVQYVWTLQ